ncbi:helix-turn-helix domain-containing protein [Actinoplanes sp. NPDC051346]|uniref:AraC-like ligand-binding domain-containing protein n=1 Tax=Actinoplanes sp. NPDC051346 TaxID=3155048 RepID=UPI0034243BE8
MSAKTASFRESLVEVVSTGVGKKTDTAEMWREYVRQACGALQVVPGPGFVAGSITSTTLGGMRLAVIKADPHTVIRRPSFARSEDGHLYVATLVSGRCVVRQDDVELAIRPGDVATFDSSRPYSLEMDQPFELISVRTRHEIVGVDERTTRLVTGTVWHGSEGMGALVHGTLQSVGRLLSNLNVSLTEPLESALNGVVSALFAERLSTAATNPVASRQLMLLRIRRYAERRLHDPALTPTELAHHYHISLRYLQMLFAEQETSPARWIRDERLARLRTSLSDPQLQHLSVAALGERWGLVDASQVSRLFRLKYGQTPSEFRRSQLGRPRELAIAA